MRYLAIVLTVLCLCGMLAACAPQEVPPPAESVRYGADGSVIGRVVYTYDENGHRTKCTYYDAEGNADGWDSYAFSEEGTCCGFVRYTAQGEPYFQYAVQAQDNYLCITPDQKIVEYTAGGKKAYITGYNDSGRTFAETFDSYGNRMTYERYNAAGEAYISHAVGGERHNVRVVVGERYIELYETDPYGTLRKERHVDSQTGGELAYREFSADGERFKQILYGYENGALLYRIDMDTADDKIMSFTVYDGKGKQILKKTPSQADGYFSVDAPGSIGAGGDKQIRVTEHTEGTVNIKQTFYSITTGKQIKK